MIAIQKEDIDIGKLIAGAKKQGTGAIVVFDGIVRDDDIREMELEAYGEVAVPELEKIASEAKETYNLLSVDIIHRIGRLAIGENILVIVVGAGHRSGGVRRLTFYHRGDQGRCPDLEKGAAPGRGSLGARRAPARVRTQKLIGEAPV